MQTNKIIEDLYRLGHFNNPVNPTGVKQSELGNLKLTDSVVKTAIRSYQDIMGALVDGEVGPETEKTFEIERCGTPDYAVEEAGRGSWPAGCHSEYPGIHSFALFIDKSGMPGYLRPHFDQAWLLCRKAYADIGIAFFEVDSQSKANTVVTWQRGSGWIGLAIVPSRPSCRDRIWAKFDNRYQPRDMINQWARLLAHEFCHNMGLSHTRGGIMNPSITSGVFTPRAWRGDPSEQALVRFFGGVPVDLKDLQPDEPDDPNIPPKDPSEYWFKGSFTLMRGEDSIEDYILTPKPKV